MQKSLPPLATLIAFEAAGRHLSFTKAAAELNLTQAAVSKQIRLLERDLGLALFERAHRSVQLTAEGRDYLHTVVTALTHLQHATRELKAEPAQGRLRVATDQSVGALILMPRLGRFLDQQPRTSVHVVVSDSPSRALAEEIDLSILHGDGHWPHHECELLHDEVVFPVCSPHYLARLGGIEVPGDLAAADLIDLDDDNWTWINWRIWLTEHGVESPFARRALTIGNYPLVVEAARRGLGVALGWQGHVDDDLARGTLVRPLAAEARTRFGYYLAWPRSRSLSAEAVIFRDWIKSELSRA
jgi:DNA-binding transcriptional LysR family regulator